MTAKERDKQIKEIFMEDMALLRAKGHDYAGNEDCLANLRKHGLYGIVVRLSDKFSRLESLAKHGWGKAEVKDESVRDTLRDIRNYAFLAELFLDGDPPK
jgi:hypothetical protein